MERNHPKVQVSENKIFLKILVVNFITPIRKWDKKMPELLFYKIF